VSHKQSKAGSKCFTCADSLMQNLSDDLFVRPPKPNFNVGMGDGGIPINPGCITLIGGAPGQGKTAYVMQCIVEALRFHDELRALVCNVEMSRSCLLERQVARISGVPLDTITDRTFRGKFDHEVNVALATIGSVADRLAFAHPPFNMVTVNVAVRKFKPQIVVLDYVQRMRGQLAAGESRVSMENLMGQIRELAGDEVAVVAVSALSRRRTHEGGAYDEDALDISSFRDSSELEYGADSAWLLIPRVSSEACEDPSYGIKTGVMLKCVKNRHGAMRSLPLLFIPAFQSFMAEADAMAYVGKSHTPPAQQTPPAHPSPVTITPPNHDAVQSDVDASAAAEGITVSEEPLEVGNV
jgi:replicative DNA helicase